MSQTFKLFRLQQIDSQLDQIAARLRQIEIAMDQDEALRMASQRADSAERILGEVSKELRKAEEEVQTQRIKIEETEASLYGGRIRNPKELQDLQNEAAALKRYLSVLEDRQLDAMLAVEEAEREVAETRSELERVQGETERENASLVAEQRVLQRDFARQSAERQAAASNIPADQLALYEQLRQSRNGVAVAKVVDRACSACGTTHTPGLLQAARSPHQITRCTTCGRILYAV
jgi:uncharacterized protein